MDKKINKVTIPKLQTRRWLAWIGGIVLGVPLTLTALVIVYFGFFWDNVAEPYEFQVLQFVERERQTPYPNYDVYIDDKRAFDTVYLKIPDGRFAWVFFADPIRSAKKRVEIALVPYRPNPQHQTHRFEAEADNGFCDAVVELRGTAAKFVGCSNRAYRDDRL